MGSVDYILLAAAQCAGTRAVRHKFPLPHSNFHMERVDDPDDDNEPDVKGIRKLEIEVQFLSNFTPMSGVREVGVTRSQ